MNRKRTIIFGIAWLGVVFLVSHGYIAAARALLSVHLNQNNVRTAFGIDPATASSALSRQTAVASSSGNAAQPAVVSTGDRFNPTRLAP